MVAKGNLAFCDLSEKHLSSAPMKLILAVSLGALALLPCPVFSQWSSNPMVNLGVAVKPGDQVQPKIRPMPRGGCYISWFDGNSGYDVYMQRLDAAGVAQWVTGGILFADLHQTSTQDYGLDVDSAGNALLAFLDDRRRGENNVTVMKVNSSGTQLFGPNGRHVSQSTDFQSNPKVAALSDGTIVVGWGQGSDLRFQKLSAAGRVLWVQGGIVVAAPSGMTFLLCDLHAGDNGTFIASWASEGGFGSPIHLLANKFDSNGNPLWGANNLAIFDGGSLQTGNFPRFVTDGAGGAVFGWYQVDPLQSRAQHILANGSEAFPHNGSLASTNTAHDQVNPAVCYNQATNSTYLYWDEILEGAQTNEGINAQRFDATGNRQWGAGGIIVQPFTSFNVINVTSVFTTAGPAVVWSSGTPTGQDSIYGAKLDPTTGAFVCGVFPVSNILSTKFSLDLTVATNGNELAAWNDNRNGDDDIYAQDIKPDCSLGQ
jgi:hypothetical protein